MTNKSSDTLLEALSGILVGKQVSTENISEYLKFLCNRFNFDCCLTYDVDQNNNMHLKEHYASEDLQNKIQFSMESISADLQECVVQEGILYFDKHSAATPCEVKLLNSFCASSIVVSSVVDEAFQAYCFIILLNENDGHTLSEERMRELTLLLNILEKYVGVRMYQSKLALTQQTFENILDNTGIDIYVNDFYNHDILYVNKSMAAPYGGKHEFMKNKCWDTLFTGQHGPCEFCPQHKIIDDHGDPTKVYSWDYQRPFDGSWFRVFSAAFRWVDGRLVHMVSSADITENKQNEALIHYMANYDALTELPNRRMLVSECERRFKRAENREKTYLLFFDIDEFKAINDNYGHAAGDEFLVQLGKFFSSIPMLKNAVYRNGGDEFVALIGGDVTDANIRILANFIHERFKKPWVLKNGSAFCNTSIGVASYPEDGSVAEELVTKADQAMYYIKQSGGGDICFYYELP